MKTSPSRFRTLTALLLAALLALTSVSSALACTTLIVGSEVSEDGSHFVGRTVDTPSLNSASVQRIPGRDDPLPLRYTTEDTGLVIDLPVKAYSCLLTPPSRSGCCQGNLMGERRE